jgi:hypothetical protein
MENSTGMKVLRNCALVCFLLFIPQMAGAPRNAWIATWAASPEPADPDPDEPLLKIEDQTVRQRVRVSIGGAQLCIRLSNEYGSAPILIGSATVATPNDPANVRPGSMQTVTFGGRSSVNIPGLLTDGRQFVNAPEIAFEEITMQVAFTCATVPQTELP